MGDGLKQDLVGRARRLLTSPSSEWSEIESEPANIPAIYKNYILPLAIFAWVAVMVGTYLAIGTAVRPALLPALITAMFGVIFTAIGVFIFALIIDGLAPTFGGHRNFGQAFKVAAYAPTAAWLVGIFMLIPSFQVQIFAQAAGGVYSLYLLYVGLPKLMKPHTGRVVPYIALTVVCAIGLFFSVALMASSLNIL